MSKSKKPGRGAADDIADGLNGLLGALNEALMDMANRLDDGASGTVERNHVFETPKGPMRAQAGVRVRVGGFETAGPAPSQPQPINPNRTSTSPPPPNPRDVPCDVIESDDHWTITADLPGIAEDEVDVSLDGTAVVITAAGRRHYHGSCDLGAPGVVPDDAVRLHNGILTLTVQKVGGA